MLERSKLRDRFTGSFDGRGESMPLQPILELCADRRIWIENHKGVRHYTRQEIWVAVSYGLLQIEGQNLKVCRMEGRLLVITGRIEHIHIHREG